MAKLEGRSGGTSSRQRQKARVGREERESLREEEKKDNERIMICGRRRSKAPF
jgi:hypothetical protein